MTPGSIAIAGDQGWHGQRLRPKVEKSTVLALRNRTVDFGSSLAFADRATQSRAFTLLEVVLALVVVGTIALAVFGSLRVAFRARDSAEAALARSRSLAEAAAIMRRDIEAAIPPTGSLVFQFLATDETGGSQTGDLPGDSLIFATGSGAADIKYEMTQTDTFVAGRNEVDPNKPVVADVHEVEYALVADDINVQQINLVRRVRKNLLAETETETQLIEQVILPGVQTIQLRYFDGTDWQDAWDSSTQENGLPAAIEMDIELATTPPQHIVQVFRLPAATVATEGNQVIR